MSLDITVTDMFCGAGGTTTGVIAAGARVRLAINHWKQAIETHNTNYPDTIHAQADLHSEDPKRHVATTVLAASPDCQSHTLAKGVKTRKRKQQALPGMEDDTLPDEAAERSRCTMWKPLEWTSHHRYQAVILENVVDIGRWYQLTDWLHDWDRLEYDWQFVSLNSMHAHPTPQSRDRLYFVAWKRGNRRPDLNITPLAFCPWCAKDVESQQSWKKSQAHKDPRRRYGKYRQQYIYACPHCSKEVTPYYYAAMNAIDWSIPTERIGDRKKPLAPKTIERIQTGLHKFSGDPFTVQVNKTTIRTRSLLGDVFPTQTGDNGLALVRPFLLNLNHGQARPISLDSNPFPTQTSYDSNGVVIPPFMIDHIDDYRLRSIFGPMSTICAGGNHQSIVTPPNAGWLVTYYNNGQVVPLSQATPTVTTKDRCGLMTGTVNGGKINLEDCSFRMLTPKEIQAAMAFPENYILKGNRREQVKMLGNAVTPPVAKLLMERVLASLS